MTEKVSKSVFKARALEFFRRVEETQEPIVITDRGRPVLRIGPYVEQSPEEEFEKLRGSVLKFKLSPGEGAWAELDR